MNKFHEMHLLPTMLPWKKEDANIFLLLDYAMEEGMVAEAVKRSPQLEVAALYWGTKDEEDSDIGPHLVKASRNSQLLQWFLEEGAEAGIMLFSEGDIELLADHLRPYLECIWPDDRRKMFRFYDPNTFYYFYPSLTRDERELFMGPICGVACTRPACAEEGGSLFVERHAAIELYTPTKKKQPWFISDMTYEAFEIPAGFVLADMLTEYFGECYPQASRYISRENIFRFAQKVVEQNRNIGLTAFNNLKVYMAQVAELGVGYMEDPQFWRINQAIGSTDSSYAILQALVAGTDEFRHAVWGDSGGPYYSALRRFLHTSYVDWTEPNSISEVTTLLNFLYPERVKYIGPQAIIGLGRMAKKEVEKWGLPPRPGIAFFMGLMLFLGAGCAEDSFYPWISGALTKNSPADMKIQAIFSAAKRLAYFELQPRKKHKE